MIGMKIEYDSFIDFCKTLEGKTISTIGGKSSFKVTTVRYDRISYELLNGKPRHTERVRIQKALERFAETGSLKTTNYTKFTQASSYTLALIREYINKKK